MSQYEPDIIMFASLLQTQTRHPSAQQWIFSLCVLCFPNARKDTHTLSLSREQKFTLHTHAVQFHREQ